MILLLLLPAQLSTAPIDDDNFDRNLVERLARAYRQLGPVQTATLGGGAPVRLDAVLRSVERHHPVLVAASARIRGARGDQLAAEGAFDPRLQVSGQATPEGYYDVEALRAGISQNTPLWGAELKAGYRIGRADRFASYDSRETLDRGEFQGGVRLPLLLDGPIDPRRAALRTTGFAVTEAESARDGDLLGLSVRAAEAYWGWVASGEVYQVALELIRLAELQGRQIDERVAAGASPEIDRAENLRVLLRRRERLVAARRSLEQAAIRLSLFLREEDGSPRVPAFESLPGPVPPAEALLTEEFERGTERALAGRPELAAFEARIEALRVETQLADNQILPRVDLELAVSKDLGSDVRPDAVRRLEPLEVKALVGVDFPLLLRTGRGRAEKAQARLAEFGAQASFLRDRIEAEVRDLWSALLASAQRADVAVQAADVAEAVASAERVRLRVGATSPFVVNLREQDAADARLAEIDARATLQVALTAWRLVTLDGAPPP